MLFVVDKEERGISLIEVVIGLAIIAIVGSAFLIGLATNFKGKMVQSRIAFGEVIASSQMEYVKEQTFSDNEWSYIISTSNRSSTQQPSWWDINNPPLINSNYTGYYAVVTAEDFDSDGDNVLEIPGDDDSVRKITASVYDDVNNLVISLEGYKANR